MKSAITQFMICACSLAFCISTAYAAGNGSSPKGKPFIAINDQIMEVEGAVSSIQEQLEILVARVDTVEQRVIANGDAIATLEAQNIALTALVQQNLSDLVAINGQIVLLQDSNATLADLIAASSTDAIADLQAEVLANEALILTLQGAIAMVQDNAISLEAGLETQIANNLVLISALSDEIDQINAKIELKQNLVTGTCPDGSAVQEVLSDGSVICQGMDGGSGQLQSRFSQQWSGYVQPGATVNVYAYCPTGYTATGAGFHNAFGWTVDSAYTGFDTTQPNYNYGRVWARNDKSFADYIFSITTCTRIAP